MTYLYGDSTPSPLTSNVLELLRDATDFGVFALQADHAIERGHDRIRELREAAKAELAKLDAFVRAVEKSIQDEDKGPGDSAASQCATRLVAMVASAHRTTTQEVEARLAAAIAEIEAEEATTRRAVKEALGVMLAQRDAAEAKRVIHVSQRDGGGYAARLDATPLLGIEWAFDLRIPESSPWHAALHVDAFDPHLEIQVPQMTGFISKELKLKPLRIERYLVTELLDDGAVVRIKLQAEAPAVGGFELKASGKTLKIARTGSGEDAGGPFDLQAEDVPKLLRLVDRLRESAEAIRGGALTKATFDGHDVTLLPKFREVVERLVAHLAPIVREISDRSLLPTELVIRKALGKDRREEIFVPKAVIRDKFAALPSNLAEVFRPLGLAEPANPKRAASSPSADEPPPVRAQLAPSVPPPPLPTPSVTPRVTTARPPASAVPPPAPVPGEAVDPSRADILEVSDDALESRPD